MSDPRSWNPWHGCRKYSEGCEHCYVYFLDDMREVAQSSRELRRTGNFDLPLRRGRDGMYKVPAGFDLSVNMTSDTFIEEADAWRDEMWEIVRIRSDVSFNLLTKRVPRIAECLPEDWGDGYDNVILNITCENQRAFDERWPIFRDIPAKHKGLNLAPLLGPIDVSPALESGQIEYVATCGESFGGERPCRYEWLKEISDACGRYGVNLAIGPVGSLFIRDGKVYRPRTMEEQTDLAFSLRLSRFYRIPRIDLYDPIDGHLLNGSEKVEPMYNADKCIRCTRMEMCRGCVDCGSCRDVRLVSWDEMVEMRSRK